MRWILAFIALIFAGCISSGNPSIRDEAAISQIKTGVTTKEDVRKLLGKPNSVGKGSGSFPGGTMPTGNPAAPLTLNSSYEVWSYSHISVETDAATFIPIIGLFAGGATSSVSSVTICFDDKGVAQYVQTSESQGRSGMGSGQGKSWDPKESY